jgi:hypothetical protein
MNPKRPKKPRTPTAPKENWIDVDELVGPGEIKEIMPGVYVNNTCVVLDPPDPIKKAGKAKPKRRKSA